MVRPHFSVPFSIITEQRLSKKKKKKDPLINRTVFDPSSFSPPLFLAEALNQGDTVDLDALMADLCSIEQELNTISKPNSTSRSQNKGQHRAPGGRSASTKHTGTSGGGSSGGSPAELWPFKTSS